VRDFVPEAPVDLSNLCEALLSPVPSARPTALEIRRQLGAEEQLPSAKISLKRRFVGRRAELDALHRAFETAVEGKAVSVIVEGASGVGKSALMQQFLDDVRSQCLVLSGRCHEREYVPYNGVDEIVDEFAAYLAERPATWFDKLDSPAIRVLPRLFPALEQVNFFATLPESSVTAVETRSGELRARTFRAFRELLSQVSRETPIVISIDDVQWIDGDTRALLAELVAKPSAPALMLVCSLRTENPKAVQEGARLASALHGDVRRIALAGLSTEESSALLRQLAGSAVLSAHAISEMVDESAGHPLFIQELVRRRREGADSSSRMRLDEALWSRVVQLNENERKLLEALSVAGYPANIDFLATAAGILPQDVPAHVAALRSANFLKISGARSPRRVETYHDRVREAVVLRLDEATRRSWHERLARSLEKQPERDVERLAGHWEEAGNAARALELLSEAAERASHSLAFDRAADFYRRALALSDKTPSPVANLQRAHAEALFNAGRGGEAGQAFLQLSGMSTDRTAMELRARAATAFLISGHFEQGERVLADVVREARLPLPTTWLALIFQLAWRRLLLTLSGLGFRRRDPHTLDPEMLSRIDVCWLAALGMSMTNSLLGAVYHAYGARLALQTGEPLRAARALCGQSIALAFGGPKAKQKTRRLLRRSREIRVGFQDAYVEGFTEAAEGFASYMLEDWKGAKFHFANAEVLFRDHCVGATFELETARVMYGRTLGYLGRFAELETYMEPFLRDALQRNDLYTAVGLRTTAQVFIALAHDDPEAAEREVREAHRALSTRGFQVQHMYWFIAASSVDLYRGAAQSVLTRYAQYRSAIGRALIDQIVSLRVQRLYTLARAHLTIAAESSIHRRRNLRKASKYARRLSSEKLAGASALARIVQACSALIAGDTERGVERLKSAMRRCDRARMALHAASVRYVLSAQVSGDQAREFLDLALNVFERQGIAAPEFFAQLYVPGVLKSSPASSSR
jgi:hypothetical protein